MEKSFKINQDKNTKRFKFTSKILFTTRLAYGHKKIGQYMYVIYLTTLSWQNSSFKNIFGHVLGASIILIDL